jgi:C-terminal peptidase prc
MTLRSLAVPLFSLWLLPLAAPAEGQSSRDEVERILDAVEDADFPTAWLSAQDLADLGEGAIAALRQEVMKGTPLQRVVVCRALLELEEASAARDGLLSLLWDAKVTEDMQVAVAGMLSSPQFQENSEVVLALRQKLEESYNPRVRLALAKALYQISPNDRKDCARLLEEWLLSDRREWRIKGALALAEIGRRDLAMPVLDEIRNDPTHDGALARAYLELEQTYRYVDRSRRLGAKSRLPREFEFLDEILQTTLALHIQGEEYMTPEGKTRLLAAAARGMLNFLDEHSTFFTSEQHERWIMELQRDYGGIGAYVDILNDVFTITRPIYSGPAYQVGLRSGDQILEVDGWSTLGTTDIQEIISRLKGPEDTMVTVQVARRGWAKPRHFDLERKRIVIPSVNQELFPGNIGYVEVSTFGRQTPKEIYDAVTELREEGARGLVLDLRFNSGGYLESAQKIVGIFVGKNKLVVRTKGRRPQDNQPYYTSHEVPGVEDGASLPISILVNRYSASASEIVTGCLRHYGRAVVVGEHSYGKGSVQTPITLESRAQEDFEDGNRNGIYDQGENFIDTNGNEKWDIGPFYKLTTSHYFLPDGSSIHRLYDVEGKLKNRGGIKPDYPVAMRTMDLWKEHELSSLLDRQENENGKTFFDAYLDENYDNYREVFIDLAERDHREYDRYPHFEEFYTSLDTRLSKDDIRYYLRAALRRRVSDDRGKTFPFPGNYVLGDFQEDNQLQAAIKVVLDQLGERPADHLAYQEFDSIELVRDDLTTDGSVAESSDD